MQTTLKNGQLIIKVARRADEVFSEVDWSLAKTAQMIGPDGRTYTVLMSNDPMDAARSAGRKLKKILDDEKGIPLTDANGSGLAKVEVTDAQGKITEEAAVVKLGTEISEEAAGLLTRLKNRLKNDYKWTDEEILAFEGDFKGNVELLRKFDGDQGLVDALKKLDDLGFSQTARRNIDNLKQRSIIDQYADDIANASNARKGNFGEIGADLDLNSKGYESLLSRIDDIDAPGHNGLDGVYRKDGQYFIIEGKYTGSASLNAADDATGLARQMSDDWIATRDWSGVNLDQSTITSLLINKNYQRVLAKVAPDGSVTYSLVDEFGYVIRGNAGIFNP